MVRNTFITAAALVIIIFSCQQNEKYTVQDNLVEISMPGGTYHIYAVTPMIFNVRYSDSLTYSDRLYAPVLEGRSEIKVEEKGDVLQIRTEKTRIDISLVDHSLSFYDQENGLKIREEKGFYRDRDTTGFRFFLKDGEGIYGTGMRALPLNRRGHKFMNYNKPWYGYGYGEDELNYCIPHVYSSNQYMLLFDNPARSWFDIGKSEKDILTYSSLKGNMSYYFINGDDFSELIMNYIQLTGSQPLPPIQTFGNFHSRFGYRNQEQAEKLLNEALASGYPIDVAVFDIYWFGPEIEDGQMGRLDWDLERWPDPKGMIKSIHDKDIHVVTVSEPFFTLKSGRFEELADKGYLATDSTGEAATIPDFYFGEAGLLDIFKPEAKGWIWDQYKRLKTYGIDGWWVDLAEPEKHPDYMRHVNGTAQEIHGVYGHEWAAMLYEGYKKDFPDERLLQLGRAGFAGSQRYGLIPWSGDVSRSWSGLKAQMPIILGMGISGLGYMHSDAGGFSMADRPDNELYTRWMQFAAFTPVFRPHSDEVIPPEPFLWPDEVQKNVKPFVELRYSMLPYTYSLAWENSTTGMPMARPMFIQYPSLPDTLNFQYMWGSDLLVAPVINPGESTKKVYLPEGSWYDFWTVERKNGGEWIEENLVMETIPVYVKAGSVLPRLSGEIRRTSQYNSANLTLQYFYSEEPSRSRVYFDDGNTPDAYKKGKYQLLEVEATPDADGISFTVTMTGNGFEEAPENRSIRLEVIGRSIKDETLSFEMKTEKTFRVSF